MRLIGIAVLSLMLVGGGSATAEEILDGSFPPDAPMTFDQMQRAVSADFDDPHSGQYKSISVQQGPDGPVLCGLANFKNAAGGYEPFAPFIVEMKNGSPKAEIPNKYPTIQFDIVAHSVCGPVLYLHPLMP